MTRPVHLVGSVPLTSAEEVFAAVGNELGASVRRVPDGETGPRSNWVAVQAPVLAASTGMTEAHEEDGAPHIPGALILPFLGTANTEPDSIRIGPLGYHANAVQSYEVFRRAREAGHLPADTRFQVSMSSPESPLRLFVVQRDREIVRGPYTHRLEQELAAVLASIPHEDLAIQWEVVAEIAALEGVLGPVSGEEASRLSASVGDLVSQIPTDVQVGLHLCYGDIGREHFIQPRDAALVTRMANAIFERAGRALTWVHLPVPRDRDDAAYFAPLADLSDATVEEIYLGLVHDEDGVAGALRRMSAAQQIIADFGIATACGMGRREPSTIRPLLTLLAAASRQ